MKQDEPLELPAELVALRDAAVASAHGEGPVPKGADELFNWMFWQTVGYDFDHPYVSLGYLNFSDADLRSDFDLSDDQSVTDEQRLEYARREIDRVWEDGERLIFAHAFRIERADGNYTYLCGTSSSGGQGGPQTDCDGCYASKEEYLQSLQKNGMSNEVGSDVPLEVIPQYWER